MNTLENRLAEITYLIDTAVVSQGVYVKEYRSPEVEHAWVNAYFYGHVWER